MSVTVHIQHEAEISELINRFHSFSYLRNISVPRDSVHTWYTNSNHWGYNDKVTYQYQIMFIGKTGYGKSTTLNKIVGKDVFDTSDVSVCTKDLYCSMYRINSKEPSFLCISDLPGIGESNYADNHYYEWYKEMLNYSEIVVYLLRADQRDFAVDEVLFNTLFSDEDKRSKVIIALNYSDKIEPINRKGKLTSEQLKNLDRKIKEVSAIFNFHPSDIIYYSATDGINFEEFVKKISDKLKSRIQ